MYLLLKEYDKRGMRTFNVEKLQGILKVPKSFKVYSEFKKKVLKKSEADIDKFTNLEVSFTEKKSNRNHLHHKKEPHRFKGIYRSYKRDLP